MWGDVSNNGKGTKHRKKENKSFVNVLCVIENESCADNEVIFNLLQTGQSSSREYILTMPPLQNQTIKNQAFNKDIVMVLPMRRTWTGLPPMANL